MMNAAHTLSQVMSPSAPARDELTERIRKLGAAIEKRFQREMGDLKAQIDALSQGNTDLHGKIKDMGVQLKGTIEDQREAQAAEEETTKERGAPGIPRKAAEPVAPLQDHKDLPQAPEASKPARRRWATRACRAAKKATWMRARLTPGSSPRLRPSRQRPARRPRRAGATARRRAARRQREHARRQRVGLQAGRFNGGTAVRLLFRGICAQHEKPPKPGHNSRLATLWADWACGTSDVCW